MKKITDYKKLVTSRSVVPDIIEERFQLCMSVVAAGPDRAFERGVSCH